MTSTFDITSDIRRSNVSPDVPQQQKVNPLDAIEDHMNNLKLLCENVLQPVRDHFGKVVTVSSGYRSPELCEAIGSSKNSQHAKGQAADFEIFDVSNQELVIWIDKNLDYDQMILEFWKGPDEPNSGWVHCSYKKEGNRKQLLRAYKEDGRTKYEEYKY